MFSKLQVEVVYQPGEANIIDDALSHIKKKTNIKVNAVIEENVNNNENNSEQNENNINEGNNIVKIIL